MATASFRLVVEEARNADVRQALADVLRSARGCPGCVEGGIEHGTAGLGGLRFHTRWDDAAELRVFLASDEVTRLLQLLELSVEEPEVLICWGDSSAGLQSLRAIRGTLDPEPSRSTEPGLTGCGCESRPEPSISFSFRE